MQSVVPFSDHETRTGHNVPSSSGTTSGTTTTSSIKPKAPKCHKCGKVCNSFKELYNHRVENHVKTDEVIRTLQTGPWTDNNILPPWTTDNSAENETLKRTYEQQTLYIKTA